MLVVQKPAYEVVAATNLPFCQFLFGAERLLPSLSCPLPAAR